MSITYSECVFVDLVIQHANAHSPYCRLWSAPLYNVSTHYLISGTIFEKKKVTEHKMCLLIAPITSACNVSHSKNKWVRYDQKCMLVFM